jgi:hypothetical protein
MAHSCPTCDAACYCGGDIDDCLLSDTAAENLCSHCPADGIDDDDDYPYPPDIDDGYYPSAEDL